MHSVSINLLPDDHKSRDIFLQRRMREKSWTFRILAVTAVVKWVPAILGFMGLYYFSSSTDINARHQAHTIWYLFVAFWLLSALCNWLQNTWLLRSHRSAMERFASPCTLTLSEDSARLDSAWGSTMLRWSAFEGVATCDHVLYLIVHPTDAWIVPKSAFADNDKYRRFAEYAERCIRGA